MRDTIGALIISIESTDLSPDDKEILKHPMVGGVILFKRNYASKQQLTDLNKSIRAARQGTPTLIMADQEGGRVQRFQGDFTKLPAMGTFGVAYQTDPQQACDDARACGYVMASELLAAGVDFSLAPVVDLDRKLNTVIGDRAFAADPAVVSALSIAFMQGMKQAGMISVGKHFPGHGAVSVDSHVSMPVDKRALHTIQKLDLKPFEALIKAGVPAIMAAHIVFPEVDEKPVGFSSIWLKKILREELGFNGIIVSDDLNMEGANISTNYADRVAAAKEAGCDLILLCNQRPGVIQALDSLPSQSYQLTQQQWSTLLPNSLN